MPAEEKLQNRQIYQSLMVEAKARIDSINILTGNQRGIPSPIVREFDILQIRMLCEIVGLACLVAHGELVDLAPANLKKQYAPGQIFAALGSSRGFGLGRFYVRRLLRTLPNFWVVLALYALWPAWRGDTPMLPLWQYLTFTQNIHLQPGTAFSHAWSLCIEEQFYMLLPAAAIMGAALGQGGVKQRWAWIALLRWPCTMPCLSRRR